MNCESADHRLNRDQIAANVNDVAGDQLLEEIRCRSAPGSPSPNPAHHALIVPVPAILYVIASPVIVALAGCAVAPCGRLIKYGVPAAGC